MEKQRAWSTPGTFSLPFLHDRLFGGKGHRKEYNPFFTFSDSLKCSTRKTASSTPHPSLQLKLISSVTRGQDSCVDTSALLPAPCHSHTELALGSKPRLCQNFFFLLFLLLHLPRKTSQYLQSIYHAGEHVLQTQQDIIKVSRRETQIFRMGSWPIRTSGKSFFYKFNQQLLQQWYYTVLS